MLLLIQPGILIFYTFSFNSVPAGLCHQISKQVFLVLRPMFQVSVSSVMNFSACWIASSDIETGVFGVATDVPGLGIECHEFQVSLLRCMGYSVDGFKQISNVDCSGIKGVNF
ncbi:uncharacterized protein [Dysidea avara]|uniref:uncharacterized protein isoform X1 n=2 Tax=Dysidea avara TaxID=196820 RepID=UPI00332A6BED